MGEEELPAGWSLDKKSYIEMRHRASTTPFNHAIVVIPKIPSVEKSLNFWQKVIENAGGKIHYIEKPEDSFAQGTLVLTNKNCPMWVEQRASALKIPLISTTFIVQSLIAGVLVPLDTQAAYLHNYVLD